MSYRPYKDLSIEQIEANIARLKFERANLKQEQSGQASNYYAPAIHYHEEELKLREKIECPYCHEIELSMGECLKCKKEAVL